MDSAKMQNPQLGTLKPMLFNELGVDDYFIHLK